MGEPAEHPHGTPPGQDPEWVPPGQGGTPPGQEDQPEEPENPEDEPHPEHPIVLPEEPEARATATAVLEPKMDFQQFIAVKQLRMAPAAALRRWLAMQGQAARTAHTPEEWEELYSAAMAHR